MAVNPFVREQIRCPSAILKNIGKWPSCLCLKIKPGRKAVLQRRHANMRSSTGGPDSALEELVRLAAVLSGADYAYLGWMDSSRLWFKCTYGFMARDQDRATTACQWMVQQGAPLLIRDAAPMIRGLARRA
jgi:hypothetical protein